MRTDNPTWSQADFDALEAFRSQYKSDKRAGLEVSNKSGYSLQDVQKYFKYGGKALLGTMRYSTWNERAAMYQRYVEARDSHPAIDKQQAAKIAGVRLSDMRNWLPKLIEKGYVDSAKYSQAVAPKMRVHTQDLITKSKALGNPLAMAWR